MALSVRGLKMDHLRMLRIATASVFLCASAVAQVPDAGEAASQSESSEPQWITDRDAWRVRPLAERHSERSKLARAELDSIEASIEKPWRSKSSRYFLVVSNTASKFTKRATAAADDFFDWCTDQFDAVTDDVVRRRVLRVVEDEDPEGGMMSFARKGANRGIDIDHDRGLETRRDTYHGNSGAQFAGLFRDQLDVFLMDKDPLLYRYMPAWLATGIGECAGTAYVKSGKLLFRAGESERDDLRMLIRADKHLSLRELLELDEAGVQEIFDAGEGDRYQFSKMARFLLLGPGRKIKPTRTFVVDYMRATIQAVDELRGEFKPEDIRKLEPDAAKDMEDEAKVAHAKARTKEFRRRRDLVTVRSFELTCAEWSKKDWAAVERAYAKYEVK